MKFTQKKNGKKKGFTKKKQKNMLVLKIIMKN